MSLGFPDEEAAVIYLKEDRAILPEEAGKLLCPCAAVSHTVLEKQLAANGLSRSFSLCPTPLSGH